MRIAGNQSDHVCTYQRLVVLLDFVVHLCVCPVAWSEVANSGCVQEPDATCTVVSIEEAMQLFINDLTRKETRGEIY